MIFYDKNNTEIGIGDTVISDGGIKLEITEEKASYIEFDINEPCLIGRQLDNPLVFSPLTAANLSVQFENIDRQLQER